MAAVDLEIAWRLRHIIKPIRAAKAAKAGVFLRAGRRAYNTAMAKKPAADTLEVDCPCCQSKLTIDRALGVVLAHTPPLRAPSIDLDDTARLLREHTDSVEAKFRASVEAEKMKEDVLARKFAEGLKKAKDAPIEKPIRDFDLD